MSKINFDDIVTNITTISSIEPRNLSDRIVKFNEEFGEFCAEIVKMQGLSPKPYDKEHLIEEGADALQVLLNIIIHICQEQNIDFEEFLKMVIIKNKKWLDTINNYTINKNTKDE